LLEADPPSAARPRPRDSCGEPQQGEADPRRGGVQRMRENRIYDGVNLISRALARPGALGHQPRLPAASRSPLKSASSSHRYKVRSPTFASAAACSKLVRVLEGKRGHAGPMRELRLFREIRGGRLIISRCGPEDEGDGLSVGSVRAPQRNEALGNRLPNADSRSLVRSVRNCASDCWSWASSIA
jgi:hypothetical protein